MASDEKILEQLIEIRYAVTTLSSNLFSSRDNNDDDLKKEQLEATEELVKVYGKYSKKEYASKKELDKDMSQLSKLADRAGGSLDEFSIQQTQIVDSTGKQINKIDDSVIAHSKLNKQLDEQRKSTTARIKADNEATAYTSKNNPILKGFGRGLKNATLNSLKLAEAEQRFAQQNAVADAGWIKGVEDMGISQLEYMKLLKSSRVESLAASTAGVDFNKTLIASKKSLEGLTLNYDEAARVAVQNYKNMASIGVSQGDLGNAVVEQTKIYKENYRALGYAPEEFAKLTSELINEQGMRSVLLTLQEKERKAYVMGVQRRMAEYKVMGYTIDRAKELQKTFQSLNNMNPKERMKKAAKKRAMMGAIGMGDEGQRLFELEVRYRTMGAEEKLKADIEMAKLQGDAAAKFGQMSGSGVGIGQAMSMQMLADKTGFNDVVTTFERVSGKGREIDIDQLTKLNEISDKAKALLGKVDLWRAADNSALGSLATNFIKGIGGFFLGKFIDKLVSRLGTGGTGGLGLSIGKSLLRVVAGTLFRGAIVGAVALAVGKGISMMLPDKVNNFIDKKYIQPFITGIGTLLGVIEEKKFAPIKTINESEGYGGTLTAAQKKEFKKKPEMEAQYQKDKAAEKVMFDKNAAAAAQLQKDLAAKRITDEEFYKYIKSLNNEKTELIRVVEKATNASTDAVRYTMGRAR